MSKSDDIDELVSSVRNFVAHKDLNRMVAPTLNDKLVLTPDSRLTDEQVKAIDAEWAAELHALEAAGIVPAGKAVDLSIAELEEAVAKLPDNWQDTTPESVTDSIENAFVADTTDDSSEVEQPAPVAIDMAAVESLIADKMGDSGKYRV